MYNAFDVISINNYLIPENIPIVQHDPHNSQQSQKKPLHLARSRPPMTLPYPVKMNMPAR